MPFEGWEEFVEFLNAETLLAQVNGQLKHAVLLIRYGENMRPPAFVGRVWRRDKPQLRTPYVQGALIHW